MKLNGRKESLSPGEYFESANDLDITLKQQHIDINSVIDGLQQKAHSNLRTLTREAAMWVTPLDRSTESPLDSVDYHKIHRGLTAGALLGYRIIQDAYTPSDTYQSEIIEGVAVAGDFDQTDPFQSHHLVGASFMNFGWQGIFMSGDKTADVIESWEPLIIPDVTKQQYVRVGAGIVFHAFHRRFDEALRVMVQDDLEAFEIELASAHDVDWDKLDWTQ